MKTLALVAAMLILAGCASEVALKDAADTPQGSGILHITWLQPKSVEIMLDGKSFEGLWTSRPCTTLTCPDVYGRVARIHRRHLRKGQAELTSKEGERLVCEWITHLPVVEGTCRAPDGRQFRLVEKKS